MKNKACFPVGTEICVERVCRSEEGEMPISAMDGEFKSVDICSFPVALPQNVTLIFVGISSNWKYLKPAFEPSHILAMYCFGGVALFVGSKSDAS